MMVKLGAARRRRNAKWNGASMMEGGFRVVGSGKLKMPNDECRMAASVGFQWFEKFVIRHLSFRPQRDQRIDFRGTSRRQITREERDHAEAGGDRGEGERVGGFDAVEEAADVAREGKGRTES